MASRLRRSLLQLGDRVGRRVQRWPEGSWPDAMQRSPRRVRSTAKDVIKSTAQAAVGLGAPGCPPGDGIHQTRQQPMNSGLLVLSVLLFVAGVTLISLG